MYRCETENEAKFVWHLAVNYISRGYFFYVKGEIPWHKDPRKTDAKILGQYGIAVSKWTRYRQREKGVAGVQYIRHKNEFVLLATEGEHRFFKEEADIRDVRRTPLKVAGYSITFWRGQHGEHVSVRVEKRRFEEIKEALLQKCLRVSIEDLIGEISSYSLLPFVPIRRQLFILLSAVNRARTKAGLERLPWAIILRQRPPFGLALEKRAGKRLSQAG